MTASTNTDENGSAAAALRAISDAELTPHGNQFLIGALVGELGHRARIVVHAALTGMRADDARTGNARYLTPKG